MKNQIIKKIMAYLLVGAMVVSTPISASATELENAYKTGTDADAGNPSGSNTNTNSDTATQSIDIPGIIDDYNLNITGIVLDKDSLSFNEVNTPDEPNRVSEALQARVLFDDYDPADEPMVWANLDYEKKKEIEKQIHWYSDNNKVAKVVWTKSEAGGSLEAVVKPQGVGQTKVYAWIEADGKAYSNNLDRPTPGDYIAEATVTVTEKITEIKFEQSPGKFFEKRTYDLKESTWLVTSAGTKICATDPAAEKLVYSLEGTVPKGSTMTLSEDGILTVKKASAATTGVKFNVVATKSRKAGNANEFVSAESQPIAFGTAIHATSVILKKNGTTTKSEILDLGKVDNTSVTITATLQYKKGKDVTEVTADDGKNREDGSTITDVVTWTSKKSSIADIEDVKGKDDLTKKIVAKGVGTTTITATASSGKKATLKVTVDATPTGVKIVDINGNTESGKTYTGKQTTLTAVLTAGKDEKGNDIELPVGKTKITWSVPKKSAATVKGKKDIGVVNPVVGLEKTGNTAGSVGHVEITVKVSGKNSRKVSYSVPDAHYTLTVEQSNISSVDVYKRLTDIKNSANKWSTIVANSAKSGNDAAYVGTSNMYTAVPTSGSYPAGEAGSDAIGWSISGAAATINDNGYLTPVKPGSSTISANYVTLDSKGKAKLNKKTVKVKVIQNATSIAFAKDQTVKNPSPKEKDQTVTLKVKSIEPKKATCNVASWKIMAYITDKDGKVDETPESLSFDSKVKKGTGYVTKTTANSITVKIPGKAQAGSVIKVGAYTNGGVVAYAYIYVTDKTTKVTVTDAPASVSLGKTVSVGTVKVTDSKEAGLKNQTFNKPGTTTAYETEPVTYSVDKTSAKYISVDQNGNVTGLQKTPGNKTATVTIKTISGKSAKVKIKVN